MKPALIKDIFREIKNSKSRFFSIFAIIALGAGLFAGLKVTTPDMIASQEKYIEEQNLMDIRLVSTYGFSDKDVDAIENSEGIREIYPSYSKDVFVGSETGSSITAKIMAYPDAGMNTPLLLEGRLPERSGECLVEKNTQLGKKLETGETISVYTTDPDDPLSDSLSRDSWVIVGIVMTPQYIAYDRGSTTIGDGTLDTFIMVPEEDFCLEVYTEIYVTLESTEGFSAFSDEYETAVDDSSVIFETVADSRKHFRLDEIKSEAYDEINKAKKEIADAEAELADAQAELDDAKSELDDGRKELDDGWAEYYDGLEEFRDGKAEFAEEIAKAEKELEDGNKQYYDGVKEYQEGKELYEQGRKQFYDELEASGINPGELQSLRSQLVGAILLMELTGDHEGAAELEAQLAGIDAAIAAKAELDAAEKELENGIKELEKAKEELIKGRADLEKAKAEAEKEFADAEIELSDAYTELQDAEKEYAEGLEKYNDGLKEFTEAKEEAETEIADAREEIADAEDELSKLREPEWFVLTRNDNPSFGTFETNVYIVENVGKVFPVFFFLVAMLVCLTTMTRMVEEQRTETGTLKALGYGNGAAISKYLVYAALASTSGAVFGIAVCVFVFPVIIYVAYGMVFILPELQFVAMPGVWILTVLVCVFCTTLAVLLVGYAELRENPAELMRPKPPKNGKRVLLERVGFIWKKFNFNHKVTVRNLFRYKKRMFMTILGIAGCAALMVAGFGIYASLSVITEKQYGEIFRYDLLVTFDGDAEEEETEKLFNELDENELVEKYFSTHIMSAEHERLGNISLLTVSDPEYLDEFIVLRDLETHEKISLTDEGIVVTERFAEIFGYSAGDVITFTCDGTKFTAEITDVTEHYTMHFIYMTDALYEKLSGSEPEKNAIISVMTDDSQESRDSLVRSLTESDSVVALTFSKTSMETFDKTIENLNYVVILIIVCAAALAFIVLYNLTNVNITERIREIATIKVLGFTDREADSYVFRENIIFSVAGAGVGLLLGNELFTFIISQIQSSEVMFIKFLPFWCYAASFLMTILFTVLVNRIMHFRLKKINMVESLKSIE